MFSSKLIFSKWISEVIHFEKNIRLIPWFLLKIHHIKDIIGWGGGGRRSNFYQRFYNRYILILRDIPITPPFLLIVRLFF